MKTMLVLASAILAVSLAAHGQAPTGPEIKAARADYDKARAKASADYTAANAECKKLEKEKQSGCTKEARKARKNARVAAGDAYTKATGKPDPSPGN